MQQHPLRYLGDAFGRVSLTLPQKHVMVALSDDVLSVVVGDIILDLSSLNDEREYSCKISSCWN